MAPIPHLAIMFTFACSQQSLKLGDLHSRCENQQVALNAAEAVSVLACVCLSCPRDRLMIIVITIQRSAFLLERLLGIDHEKSRLLDTTTRVSRFILCGVVQITTLSFA